MKIFNIELAKEQVWIISAILAIIVFLGLVLFGIIPGLRDRSGSQAQLEFWGLYDGADTWQSYIDAFNRENRGVVIRYIQKDPETYEKELIDALAAGTGPDIMMFHSTWLAKHGNKVWPLPESLMTKRQFQETFPDAAFSSFVANNQIYALAIWTDALAMYYNKDLFNSAGIAVPPATWDDFIRVAVKLSSKDRFGNLTKSAAALGTSNNVNNAADILSLLMLQVGAKMISDDGSRAAFNEPIKINTMQFNPGQNALSFYTDFANSKLPVYTWNANQQNSREAFIQGKVAIIFDYHSALGAIRQGAPNLRLGVAPMPQPKDAEKNVNYAKFWGYSVPATSKNPEAAWRFLAFMTGKDIEQSFADYTQRPASRRDILTSQQNSPDLGVFADAVLSAVNWYQADPKEVDKIFRDLIDEVALKSQKPQEALNRAAEKVSLLMSR